jgi:hypothetical protein
MTENSYLSSVPKEVKVEITYGKNEEIILKSDRNGIFLGEVIPLFGSALIIVFLIMLFINMHNQFLIALIMFAPFLTVVLVQFFYMIDAVVEYQQITISHDKIRIEKRRFFKNRNYYIENISGDSFAFKKFGISLIPPYESFRYGYKSNLFIGDGFEIPIVYSTNNYYCFFENRSILEQKWIMLVVKEFYKQKM